MPDLSCKETVYLGPWYMHMYVQQPNTIWYTWLKSEWCPASAVAKLEVPKKCNNTSDHRDVALDHGIVKLKDLPKLQHYQRGTLQSGHMESIKWNVFTMEHRTEGSAVMNNWTPCTIQKLWPAFSLPIAPSLRNVVSYITSLHNGSAVNAAYSCVLPPSRTQLAASNADFESLQKELQAYKRTPSQSQRQ